MSPPRLLQRVLEPASEALARLKLRHCTRVGTTPQVRGRVVVWGGGRVELGDRVRLDGRACAVELHAAPGAEIWIGDDVVLEAGTSVEATGVVRIGARSHLGRFCKLMDNQFHSTRGDRALTPEAGAVQVGCDVDIGPHAVLLPGAVIDDGASVDPGRVVSRRVIARSPAVEPRHGR